MFCTGVNSKEFQYAASGPIEPETEQMVAAIEENVIRVYPNPAQGVLHVTLDAAAIADGKVIVLDKFSNVVLTGAITAGDHIVTLNLGALPPDTYYLKVIIAN
jgi:hypothetical protein